MNNYPTPMSDVHAQSLIGTRLGIGGSREVFSVPTDPDVVIKKLLRPIPGSNMIEWLIWNGVKETNLSNLFGKCLTISESATYLIMERLDDLQTSDLADIPNMPEWLNDRKPDAFGKANGLIKVRDYGVVNWNVLISTAVGPIPLQVEAKMKRQIGAPGY